MSAKFFTQKLINVKKIPLVIALLLFCFFQQVIATAQTTYYVASSGNDANSGTSVSEPFQSLNKVNSLSLQPGDQVLFKRGDTFRGTLYIQRSGSSSMPIIYDAYGTGAKPALSGSTPVTGWTSAGNNIWQTTCSACGDAVTGLYKNGKVLPLGRYPNMDAPNKGNLTIRAHTEKYQIFSLEYLPANIDWKGAEVVMRPAAWIIDRAVVDAQYGDALNLFNYSNYTPKDNSEYFFQNHPATLDRQNEWCYEAGQKRLSVYSSQPISAADVYTANTQSRVVDINNVGYVTLRNLLLTESANTTIYVQNASNITFSNLDITDAGEDAITFSEGGNNILIENNKIFDVNNNAVNLGAYQNVTFRGNIIRRVGIVAGRGKSGDGQYNGIASAANQNVLIEKNVIDSIGYNGITFVNSTVIQQNLISNYCYTKIDGGGIYAWNGNNQPMMNNRILNNILYTNYNEKIPWVDYTIGIFLDDCVENVEVSGNTIFGNSQWGAFLHAANTIKFTNNTLFDNRTCQFVMYHNGGKCLIRNNVVKRNIFFSKQISQLVGQYESHLNDLLEYGQIDSNYYARPFNEEGTIRGIVLGYQGGNFNLSDWKNSSGGLDTYSKSSPITYAQYRNDGAGGTTRVNNTFTTGVDDWQLVYSRYGNAEAAFDNTNKLNGGSLRIGFPTPSGQSGSYAQAAKPFGLLEKGKTYVLRFDAIASKSVPILVYLRDYGAPYNEYDRRYTVTIDEKRKSYELFFTATGTQPNSILMFQTDVEGPVFWLDNVRLQEGAPIQNNPDDFIKLFYNPTLKDSTISLTDNYRDVKNKPYTGSFVLKPFTSVVLLKDTVRAAPADLSIALVSDRRTLQVNEIATMRLTVRNESNNAAELARWTYRLPANIQFASVNGQPYSDNVLTQAVYRLAAKADTSFTFTIRPTAEGLFRTAAQLTTATSPDPDSTPNTGTADGEDDAATAELRVGNSNENTFESPNPVQRTLPAVQSNQPAPDPNKADLSLRMAVDNRVPLVGETITITLYVANAGGKDATDVQLDNQLSEVMQLVEASGWAGPGGDRLLSYTFTSVPAGTTVSASFKVRLTSAGMWINKAQISKSVVNDPDSVPGNGYDNGEDDQAQIAGQTR